MAQMLGGLITYLLLAIHCHEKHNEKVSIYRVRELRIRIRNEIAANIQVPEFIDEQIEEDLYAKT